MHTFILRVYVDGICLSKKAMEECTFGGEDKLLPNAGKTCLLQLEQMKASICAATVCMATINMCCMLPSFLSFSKLLSSAISLTVNPL